MDIAPIGSFGLGSAWGWLTFLLARGARRVVLTSSVLAGATLLLAAEVFILAGRVSTLTFVLGAALAFLIHLGWNKQLRSSARSRAP